MKQPSNPPPFPPSPDSESTVAEPPESPKALPTKPKLLIVDDDEEIRAQMRWGLAGEYEVFQAGDRSTALEQFRSARPLVVLLDLGLPPNPATPEEGLATLTELLSIDRLTKIVIVSGQGEKGPAL